LEQLFIQFRYLLWEELVLFGIIASVGVRTLIEARFDFTHSRNLIITALNLVTGIAINNVKLGTNFLISGLAIAPIIGVIINKLFPKEM
jgi:uracil permease